MKKKKAGFTILELTIAASLCALLAVLACSALFGLSRVVSMDSTVGAMARDGDRALTSLTNILRPAILPIKAAARTDALQTVLNSTTQGFGSHGADWLAILQNGSDCLAFTSPADFGGDGDFVDADMMVELGIVLPDGTHVPTGEYSGSSNNKLNGSVNPRLAALKPKTDLGLRSDRTTLNTSAPRFAQTFAFPAGANAGYGIIRFAPRRVGGAPFIIQESSLGDRGYDLNNDGDTTDTFMLGRLEIVVPNVIRNAAGTYVPRTPPATYVTAVTGNTVLLQTNQNDDGWTPIFKLVSYRDSNPVNMNSYEETTNNEGEYTLLIRLLMCDALSQASDPQTFGKKTPAVTRQFETVVKMRNFVVQATTL